MVDIHNTVYNISGRNYRGGFLGGLEQGMNQALGYDDYGYGDYSSYGCCSGYNTYGNYRGYGGSLYNLGTYGGYRTPYSVQDTCGELFGNMFMTMCSLGIQKAQTKSAEKEEARQQQEITTSNLKTDIEKLQSKTDSDYNTAAETALKDSTVKKNYDDLKAQKETLKEPEALGDNPTDAETEAYQKAKDLYDLVNGPEDKEGSYLHAKKLYDDAVEAEVKKLKEADQNQIKEKQQELEQSLVSVNKKCDTPKEYEEYKTNYEVTDKNIKGHIAAFEYEFSRFCNSTDEATKKEFANNAKKRYDKLQQFPSYCNSAMSTKMRIMQAFINGEEKPDNAA